MAPPCPPTTASPSAAPPSLLHPSPSLSLPSLSLSRHSLLTGHVLLDQQYFQGVLSLCFHTDLFPRGAEVTRDTRLLILLLFPPKLLPSTCSAWFFFLPTFSLFPFVPLCLPSVTRVTPSVKSRPPPAPHAPTHPVTPDTTHTPAHLPSHPHSHAPSHDSGPPFIFPLLCPGEMRPCCHTKPLKLPPYLLLLSSLSFGFLSPPSFTLPLSYALSSSIPGAIQETLLRETHGSGEEEDGRTGGDGDD